MGAFSDKNNIKCEDSRKPCFMKLQECDTLCTERAPLSGLSNVAVATDGCGGGVGGPGLISAKG